jgi:protein-S-isoprenylcysteine O-methyltransferase Ste14
MGDEDTPGEWSDEQRREFRRALDERRRRTAVGGQLFAGLLVALVAAGVLLRLPADWWVPAVGIVALAALVFRLANWKCPACGEGLPARGSGRTCRGCGLPLD